MERTEQTPDQGGGEHPGGDSVILFGVFESDLVKCADFWFGVAFLGNGLLCNTCIELKLFIQHPIFLENLCDREN